MRLKRLPTQGSLDREHAIISNHKIRSVCTCTYMYLCGIELGRNRALVIFQSINAAVDITNLNGAKEIHINLC